MWTRYSSLFPYPKAAIWKLVTLFCSGSRFLSRSMGGGTYGIGGQVTKGQATNFLFLLSEFFRPSGGDFSLEIMVYCQSGVSQIRRLKVNLGGTCRIFCRGSTWYFANPKILIFAGSFLLDLPGGGEGLVLLHQNGVFSKQQCSRRQAWFWYQSVLAVYWHWGTLALITRVGARYENVMNSELWDFTLI